MLTRLVAFGAGLFLIGLAVAAWRMRSSTTDGYRAMWRATGGDRRADSFLVRAQAAQGTYLVVFISAAMGIALLIRAALP